MKSFILLAAILLSTSANAASYYCIVAPQVSNKFYEYQEGRSQLTYYEMKLDISAVGFVGNHPREASFNTKKDVTDLGDYELVAQPGTSARYLIVNGDINLQVTEPKERPYQYTEVTKNADGSPLIFAGKKVDSVFFIVCGKD